MRIIGFAWKIYLGVAIVLLLFWLARVVFGNRGRAKELLTMLPIIVIWPLALLHPIGRAHLGLIVAGPPT